VSEKAEEKTQAASDKVKEATEDLKETATAASSAAVGDDKKHDEL